MSASTTPTLSPCRAMAVARLTVTDDLPTPPLPEAIAKTLVSDPGWAKGISRETWPPRSFSWSPERCSSVMTPRSTWTSVTPGTPCTAAVTSRVRRSRIGQPETVSRIRTATEPSGCRSTASTMPSSVMGRRISGSSTRARAAWTCSRVGVLMTSRVRGRLRGVRVVLGCGLRACGGPLLDLREQGAQLGADVVAGGDLAQRHPQAGHLPGQELHVGVRPRVREPVALGDHPVLVLLAVLCQQDQGRGVRRLEAEHEREEDEGVGVERGAAGEPVPAEPHRDEQRHVE